MEWTIGELGVDISTKKEDEEIIPGWVPLSTIRDNIRLAETSQKFRDYKGTTVIIRNGKTDRANWYLKKCPLHLIEGKKSYVKSNKDKTMYYLK